jgi:thiamine pyrophosphokinase
MAGDSVSLLPWGNVVIGITTGGLRWPLIGETLYPHKTRGISNEMLGELATIKFDSGLLLCIHQKHKPE